MKFVFLLLLTLFLANSSNSLGKCYCPSENSSVKCVVCDRSPCQCEELILEERPSYRKLILNFLKTLNFKGTQECRYCRDPCPKKHGIAQVLANILRKACTSDKEEEAIRDIITKLVDPQECRNKPGEPHCDPQVQLILRKILKKAVGCNCQECPSTCYQDRPHCGQEEYKHWFKTSKEKMRKEISGAKAPDSSQQNRECSQGCKEAFRSVKTVKKFNKNKEVYECISDTCRKCKTCQRPDSLICPRYMTDDFPIKNVFSICADCTNCHIKPCSQTNSAVLLCKDCTPINSPFIQFTQNGHPFKRAPEIVGELQITTKYVQIDDFREKEAKSFKNPFLPKSNGSLKKKVKGSGKKRKFKWLF